jgi:delta-1-pyrroline-5-carboxylate synthetase
VLIYQKVLVTKSDFEHPYTSENLHQTLEELFDLNIIPILNTNDAIAPPPDTNKDIKGMISIKDNDTLAARIGVLVNAELLVLMSDVDGIYSHPPGDVEARLLSQFSPKYDMGSVEFGTVSKVGTGGMQSKVFAAEWALENDCSVVICNGQQENAIIDIVHGKRIGTFFTDHKEIGNSAKSAELEAKGAREGARVLQSLTAEERSNIIKNYSKLLVEKTPQILEANKLDIEAAKRNNLSAVLQSRLVLTERKIATLVEGMNQIADHDNILGKVLKCTQITDDLILQQVTVPIGVICVIFESRPDSLPQVC